MNVIFKITTEASLNDLPIKDGQLIIIRDGTAAVYYDIDGTRHEVKSTKEGLVTLDTAQVVLAPKQFEELVTMKTLQQGIDCITVEGAHAEGNGSTAYGQYSHAEGISTSADGVGSHSSGNYTVAQGNYSSSFGNNTISEGKGSVAQGACTTATGDYSTVVGTGNEPNSTDLFQVGNGTVVDASGELLPETNRTYSNAMRVTRDGKVIAETDVELENGIKLSDRENVANKVTSIGSDPSHTQYPSAKAVKDFVDAMPEPMLFKGTVGTGGTITTLPSASSSNEGFTYKVITNGTYQGVSAKIGDTFISNGSEWVLIPSGDEPTGTVTNVAAQGSNGIQVTGGPITASGTLNISGTNASQSANGMMTAIDKKKLDGIQENAQLNVIETVRVNGTALTPTSKTVDITIPTSLPSSDVYDWAKQPNKPSYTYSEVGAAAASHTHSSVSDIVSGSKTTFAYSKDGLGYSNYTWLAGWNGYELRAVNKNQFATASHTHSNYLTGITKKMVTDALGYTPPTTDTNTWRPLGTTADTACAGNDSRLSNARPASDVYAWAKASTKPSYTYSEVGAAAASHSHSSLSTGNFSVGFNSTNDFAPTSGAVYLGSTNNQWPRAYITSIYEDGTSLSEKYAAAGHTHSYLPSSGGTVSGSVTITESLEVNNFYSSTHGVHINTNGVELGNVSGSNGILDVYNSSRWTRVRGNSSATDGSIVVLPAKGGTLSLTTSDARLKDNITDSTVNALSVINAIKIRQFDWNDNIQNGMDRGTHQNIGFIADELEEIDKRFAFGGGEEKDGEMNIKGVDSFYMLGYVVKALQELSQENELLKDRINTLENK